MKMLVLNRSMVLLQHPAPICDDVTYVYVMMWRCWSSTAPWVYSSTLRPAPYTQHSTPNSDHMTSDNVTYVYVIMWPMSTWWCDLCLCDDV